MDSLSNENAKLANFGISVINPLSTLFCLALVDKIGRRPFMLTSLIGMAASHVLLTIVMNLGVSCLPCSFNQTNEDYKFLVINRVHSRLWNISLHLFIGCWTNTLVYDSRNVWARCTPNCIERLFIFQLDIKSRSQFVIPCDPCNSATYQNLEINASILI